MLAFGPINMASRTRVTTANKRTAIFSVNQIETSAGLRIFEIEPMSPENREHLAISYTSATVIDLV